MKFLWKGLLHIKAFAVVARLMIPTGTTASEARNRAAWCKGSWPSAALQDAAFGCPIHRPNLTILPHLAATISANVDDQASTHVMFVCVQPGAETRTVYRITASTVAPYCLFMALDVARAHARRKPQFASPSSVPQQRRPRTPPRVGQTSSRDLECKEFRSAMRYDEHRTCASVYVCV